MTKLQFINCAVAVKQMDVPEDEYGILDFIQEIARMKVRKIVEN